LEALGFRSYGEGTLHPVISSLPFLSSSQPSVLPALAGIVAAGVAAQWLAWRLKVPSILLLLAMGLLLGPFTGLIDPEALSATC
jgi:hypothetical protein